jgi:hypothetical protein
VKPPLYRLLDYDRARRMADAIADLPGRETLDYVSELLALEVEAAGLEHVPTAGKVVIICNHPTGIADGLAVYQGLKAIRGDMIFYANADALRVSPRLASVIIPVEWVEHKRHARAHAPDAGAEQGRLRGRAGGRGVPGRAHRAAGRERAADGSGVDAHRPVAGAALQGAGASPFTCWGRPRRCSTCSTGSRRSCETSPCSTSC